MIKFIQTQYGSLKLEKKGIKKKYQYDTKYRGKEIMGTWVLEKNRVEVQYVL